MRFKKLRLFVGISLVIFIFVFGSVILGGFFKKGDFVKISSDKNNIIPKDNKKSTSQQLIVKEVTNSNNENTQVNNPVITQPAPVIVHTQIRTRAS